MWTGKSGGPSMLYADRDRGCRACRRIARRRRTRRHPCAVSSSELDITYVDAVIHLLMGAKHSRVRKSRNATSLTSTFKSFDTLKVKIISVTFRSVTTPQHINASQIWWHDNIHLGAC